MSTGLMALAFSACEPDFDFNTELEHGGIPGSGVSTGGRVPSENIRNVLLLYSAGYNDLSRFLSEDIAELKANWLPGKHRSENVLLIYSHLPAMGNDFSTPNPPVLTRVWKNDAGGVVTDTLVVYAPDARSATSSQLNEVLSYVKETFPAKSYGMIFSSHATGYLPAGYYSNPKGYVFQDRKVMGVSGAGDRFVEYVAPVYDPELPAVKSIGQDRVMMEGPTRSYEMELNGFADAIPMYMDYILFDACLMGGVEVAYGLRDKCRYLGFSQAEVLAEGFDYSRVTTHLLAGESPDPQGVCEDYFNQYIIQSGVYQSATISMIDCSRMDRLADVCGILFEKYREAIASVSPGRVQRFFRGDYHWFYDLKDILIEAGVSDEELASVDEALNECVVYKGYTPRFMNVFEIEVFSGFSMYLPCNGGEELDKYYKTLQWNIDTGLVI